MSAIKTIITDAVFVATLFAILAVIGYLVGRSDGMRVCRDIADVYVSCRSAGGTPTECHDVAVEGGWR